MRPQSSILNVANAGCTTLTSQTSLSNQNNNMMTAPAIEKNIQNNYVNHNTGGAVAYGQAKLSEEGGK